MFDTVACAASRRLDAGIGASERHDLAVRQQAALVSRAANVHCIPPRVDDVAQRPSVGRDGEGYKSDLPPRSSNISENRKLVGGLPRTGHEALVARGRQALDTLDLGMRDIAFLTDGGRGVVRVGADMAFIAGGLMADIITHLRTRYPGIAVHVLETSIRVSAPEYHSLMERGVDVVLGRRPHENIDGELFVEHLLEEKLKIVASSTHHLARRNEVNWSDLTGETWILAATDSIARLILEDQFRQRGLPVPDARSRPTRCNYACNFWRRANT